MTLHNSTEIPPSTGPHLITSLLDLVGLSTLAGLFSNQYLYDSVKLFVLGSLLECARRLSYWVFDRFKLRYCISAQFKSGDPIHDWILLSLIEQDVWQKSRDFEVTAKTSLRKWGIGGRGSGGGQQEAEFVPAYGSPHLFRWKGYWMEVEKGHDYNRSYMGRPAGNTSDAHSPSTLSLTIYTLDMSVLSGFIEAARLHYMEVSKPRVTVHTHEHTGWLDEAYWNRAMTKFRRPMGSVILDDGVVDGLLDDAREFFESREWYFEVGIPHRRGYLMYGPPGTGKTSTIHTLAGELGLEIYYLSLSSADMDDAQLSRAVSNVPAHSILLIEDIDCAFPSRDDEEAADAQLLSHSIFNPTPRRAITLSGLLNAIDGVGSDEGRLFFATTNHVEQLDPALVRPGRIDVKIEYKLASHMQALALFEHFFPAAKFEHLLDEEKAPCTVLDLAARFAEAVPENEFSTAELQGFLLSHKKNPVSAIQRLPGWVESERKEKREREASEKKRKERIRLARANQMKMQQVLPISPVPFEASETMSAAGRSSSDFDGSEDHHTLVGGIELGAALDSSKGVSQAKGQEIAGSDVVSSQFMVDATDAVKSFKSQGTQEGRINVSGDTAEDLSSQVAEDIKSVYATD